MNAERELEILLEAINAPAAEGRISADFEDEVMLKILERDKMAALLTRVVNSPATTRFTGATR